ncbi:MAG: hypothetical protein AAFR87_23205 [Bacteroidota bacterium]
MKGSLKNLLILSLFILPHSLSAQQSPNKAALKFKTLKAQPVRDTVLFDRAYSLQKNEILVKDYVESGLMSKYLQAGYTVDTLSILQTYSFYQTPFDTSFSPNLQAVADLQYQFRLNRRDKAKRVPASQYPFLRICENDFPEAYELFLDNELLILNDAMIHCMKFESLRDSVNEVFTRRIPQIFIENKIFEQGLYDRLEKLQLAYQQNRDSLNLPDSSIMNSFQELKKEIAINKEIKSHVPNRFYRELRRCRADYPDDFQVFLEKDSIVIDQETADCFLRRIPSQTRQKVRESWQKAISKERSRGLENISSEEELDEINTPTPTGPSPAPVIPPPGKVLGPLSQGTGIFPTTQLIDATAQFLVERTREELILSFFDQFQRRIDSVPELRYLFTNTYSLLQNREFFHIPTLGKTWKTAFVRDIRDLPLSMERMVNESPKFLFLKQRSDYRVFLMALHFTDWFKKSGRPSNYVLSRFVEMEELSGGAYMDSALAVVKNNLQDFRTSFNKLDSWYYPNFSYKLNKQGEEFFIALQYQKSPTYYEKFYVGNGESYAQRMKKMPNSIFKMEQEIISEIRQMDESLLDLDIPQNPQVDTLNREAQLLTFSDYLYQKENSLRLAADGLNNIQRIAYKLKYPDNPEAVLMDKSYQGKSQLVYAASQLLPAIESRSPSKIFVHSLQALQPLFQIAANRENKRIKSWNYRLSTQKLDTTERNSLIKQIEKSLKRQNQLENSSKYLAFYGGFMLDIFYAKSAPEIKGLLYKYALPAGSYRIKRKSQISLELGAYPNLYVGREFIIQADGQQGDGWVAGVSAPVGLSVSWPIRKRLDPFDPATSDRTLKNSKLSGSAYSGHSFSLFFPVIDIAAPFSYRWTNGNDVGFPDEISWQQILSPGLYAVWGMKNKPISLSLGGQYVPKLRSITSNGTDVRNLDAFRIGLNLAVDIPLFSLFRR